MQDIKVKYFTADIEPLSQSDKGDWVDLRAAEDIIMEAGDFRLIPLGVAMELPEGYEAQIRPRSGLAAKFGVTVANAPGTVDADYRGEVKVILVNLSKDPFVINPGERIAQMVIAKYDKIEWEEVEELGDTERGDGGFGSTGRK